MSDQVHLQSLAEEFNARAKAEGRYLEQDFWDIPSQPGSILDVPQSVESRERVARLRAQIAALEVDADENNAGPAQGILTDARAVVHEGQGETTGK